MAERDKGFDPATLDDDFEQLQRQLPVEDAQLVQALLKQHSFTRARSARALAHAWERIQQAQQPSALRSLQDERTLTVVPIQTEIERKPHMREKTPSSQKPSWLGRIVNGLVAAVLLTVIVGSMVLVYSHFHSQTGTGSGPQSTQTTITITPTQSAAASTPSAQKGLTPTTGGSLPWPVGQSTYWANLRYHQLTSNWVTWKDNANQWVASARAAGWNVSTSPHVPSIIVLMPYVQGAGG